MKINNEYIEIKIGNKIYTKKNMILNKYLKKLFNMQTNDNFELTYINYCYLKLDTPIENVDYNTDLNGLNDFDIRVWSEYTPTFIATDNNIKITYKFGGSRIYAKDSNGNIINMSNLNNFEGRKITAIGFGIGNDCMAFLDTNNMDIIINNGESFIVTRVDNIVSDGILKNLEYPLHLINNIANKDKEIVLDGSIGYNQYTHAKLYSVGFGNVPQYMEEEYLIDDVEVNRDDYSITFNLNRTKKIGHYPSENLQLGFYPTLDNSKYLIFKYRLYRRYYNSNTEQYVITYLDEYYTMSKPNETFGDLNIKLKIERL